MQRTTPVYLNIYDLTSFNDYLYWFGIGIFHSGIEINEVEYAFGGHDFHTCGIFEVKPRSCPGFTFRRSIAIGSTDLSPSDIWNVLDDMSSHYTGDSYNFLTKNCNHFTNELCLTLTGRSLPGWVNRLAGLGSFCSCVLPESFLIITEQQSLEYSSSEDVQSFSNDSGDETLLLVPSNANCR